MKAYQKLQITIIKKLKGHTKDEIDSRGLSIFNQNGGDLLVKDNRILGWSHNMPDSQEQLKKAMKDKIKKSNHYSPFDSNELFIFCWLLENDSELLSLMTDFFNLDRDKRKYSTVYLMDHERLLMFSESSLDPVITTISSEKMYDYKLGSKCFIDSDC